MFYQFAAFKIPFHKHKVEQSHHLIANQDDIVYEWDTNEDTVREFGTLFDFLKYYRQITTSKITGKHNNDFKELTTGHLL